MCEARGGGDHLVHNQKSYSRQGLGLALALRASRDPGGSQACMLLYKRRKPEGHLRGTGRVSAWTWVGGFTLPESSKPCLEAAPWTHGSRT